jgi:uncharacterized protein YwgA
MDANNFVTLTLLAVGGEIGGKTKLQKTVYFLGLMADCSEDLGYRAHFYGPYSDEVANAVTWLKTIGAIDQNITSWGCDPSGFEARRYDYRFNDQGRRFAEAKARQNPALYERLQKAEEVLRQAGDIGYMEMSVAAKTYFLLGRKKGRASTGELAQLAPKLGWSVTPKQAQRAAQYLNQLGLVEVTQN